MEKLVPIRSVSKSKESVQKNHDVLNSFGNNSMLNTALLNNKENVNETPLIKNKVKKKKGLNCYMLFANDKRREFCQANPNAKPTEISKLLGKAWRDCSDCEKSKYLSTAANKK